VNKFRVSGVTDSVIRNVVVFQIVVDVGQVVLEVVQRLVDALHQLLGSIL
jgi:hypothetical protein